MRKNLLVLFVLFCCLTGYSQGVVVSTTSNGNANPTQLVNYLLGTGSCLVQPANATKSTGLSTVNYAQGNSIGTFTNTNTAFPMTSGVVLVTGDATTASGPNTSISSDNSVASQAWMGDADLQAAFASAGITINSMNATALEFDFTAATTSITIPYVFASEEYGSYQCASKDGFAILLKVAGSPSTSYINLATIPTTTTPVSVATVRNSAYNSTCTSQNAAYFGLFNGGGASATAANNFEGQTVLMNATYNNLVPGTTYHIKIVIADDGDANPTNMSGTDGRYNSAVFFPQGALNLGQQVVGNSLLLSNNTALCEGDSYTINTGLSGSQYSYVWTKDNTTQVGTGSSLTVTTTGNYSLQVTNANTSCTVTEAVNIEFAPQLSPGQPVTLYACPDGGTTYTYNLALNTPNLKQGLDPATIVTYHATAGAAANGTAALNTTYSTNGGTVTIYARVKSHNSSCYVVVPFDLMTIPAPTATQPANLQACEASLNAGNAVFNLTAQDAAILGSQTASQFTITYYTSAASANAGTDFITTAGSYTSNTTTAAPTQTIYARVQSTLNTGCYAVTSFTIHVNPLPAVSTLTDVTSCGSYVLPAITNGNYFTGTGGTGTPLFATNEISTSQTIYIYATNANCSNQSSFQVTILAGVITPSPVTECENYALPALGPGQEYHYQPNGADPVVPSGTVITTTTTVYFFIPTAASCTANSSFLVTIVTADDPADVNSCTPYTLPAAANGTYYSATGGPNGTGTALGATPTISTSQTVYVYNENTTINCVVEHSFEVNIGQQVVPVADVVRCGRYILPTPLVGEYYASPGGVGTPIPAGTVITSTQTLYLYTSDPSIPGCSSEDSFLVTINQLPGLGYITDVVSCTSYTLPALTNLDTYNTAVDMSGTPYSALDFLTSSITLYAISLPNAEGCRRNKMFTVTIVGSNAPNPGSQSACGSFVLPVLSLGKYYTLPGGPSAPGNTEILAGTVITSTQTIYVYAVTGVAPNQCTSTSSFTITILPIPTLGNFSNVVACSSYTLPALSSGNYYGGPNGTNPIINNTLTASQTVYVYVTSNTTPQCSNQKQFNVTIINGSIAPPNVTTCGSYTLPALDLGSYYMSQNGVGTPVPAGTVITSTTTLYPYTPVTSGANCTGDDPFVVTITTTPTVQQFSDMTVCNSYVLPALTSGNYYTGANGTGTFYSGAGGDIITQSHIFYIYNSNPGCTAQSDFYLTINQVSAPDLADQTVCSNEGYTLPPIAIGYAYYTMAGGPATAGNVQLFAGDVITTDSDVWTYGQLNGTTPLCYDEKSFHITTVAPPAIDDLGVVASCTSYTLPALTTGGSYFTGPGGTGTPLFAGQEIYTSQTIYIFAQSGGTPNCSNENEVTILVNPEPPDDVTACDSYTLPVLPAGQHYFESPSGGGDEYFGGDVITATQTIYFYIPTAAACTDTASFLVTINDTPVLDPVTDIVTCDEYILPALMVGNYYTITGGPTAGGQVIPAGTAITTTQDVFVYAETGTTPNCFAETSFNVNITATPATVGRSDVEVCDSYDLPPIPAGYGYYLLSGGPTVGGQTQLVPGTPGGTISSNADPVDGTIIYIYSAAAANADCFMETSFSVIIYSAEVDGELQNIVTASTQTGSNYWAQTSTETTVGDPLFGELVLDVEACDTYALPDINVGGSDPADTYLQHYYTLQGGPDVAGQQMVTDLNITASSTVYLYRRLTGRLDCSDEARIDIIINQTPVVDDSQADLSDCFTHTLPALTVGAYYNNPGGNGLITDLTLTASQTVYIYAQTGVNHICSDEHSYYLTINTIDVPDPTDVISCDSYDLPTPNPGTARYFAVSGGPGAPGQTEYAVGYTFLPGDYDIWVWDETQTTPNCTDEETFHIKVVARPIGIIPTGLVTCAIDDQGHGIFDLTGAIAQAIGTQPLVAATIHLTLEDAQFNTNIWTNVTNFTNGNANSQTIYIRLYSTISTDCYTVVPLQLTVNPRPVAVDPIGPYAICDNGISDTDGIGVFDLTTYQTAVLGTLDPTLHTVTYYESIANIENGGPAIASPANYNTVSTTVYLKVTINATGCYDIVPLQLIVNPLPVVTNPTPLTLCDDNAPGNEVEVFDLTSKINEITGGVNGLTATFHFTLDDAEDNIGAIGNPTAYENTTSPAVQAIFVRITDNVTGCYRLVLLDIRVEPLPVLTQPTTDELTTCSTNEDGFGNFNLDDLALEMIDGGTNMTVKFYYTMTDAENGTNFITDTTDFENSNAFNDVLYVVATNTITGCQSVVYVINLVIDPAPEDVILQDITLCDTDSNTQNLSTVFDLTVQTPVIETQLGATPNEYAIRYFTSQINAEAGTPRITVPSAYVGTEGQVIWVRIENPATGCFIVTSFELHVNAPQQLAHPTPLIVCDDLGNDGFAAFDLTQKDDEILTPTGIGEMNVVQYFILQADRDNAVNWIDPATAFTNTVAGYQTIYVLVTTPQGCISKESLTLVVNPSPNPNFNPDTLVLCDDVTIGDGIEVFDLTDAAVNILAGDTQSVLTYYANAADEAAGIQIPDPANYANAVPWDDTVVIRVTRTDTQPGSPACSQVVTLPLHVNPLPPVFNSAGVVPLYAICNDPTTGFEQFNLIGHITDLITAAGEDPTNFDIRFYLDMAAVTAGTALPHTYTNVTPGHQQIYVYVKNFTTDCEILTTLDLYAEQAAVANPVTSAANSPIVECDYDGTNDGFTQFDLTPAGAEVLGTQNPAQFSVEYYTTEAAANAGDTTALEYIATPAAYTNTEYLTQTIWVRITNTGTISPCYAVTSFGIRVSLLEEPNITNDDNDHFICVDYNDGTVYKPVLLESNAVTAGDTYQWYLNGVAIAGATSDTYSAVEEGLYTVEVWNVDGCISDPIAAYEIFLSGPATPIDAGYVVSNAFGDNQTITVLVRGFGDYQYALVPEDADGNSEALGPWQNSNVFTNVPQGYFTIYVRDMNTLEINPCNTLAITGVSVIDYPKYFTPNGDGINDYWNIVGMVNHPEARIYIFDRYGKLIKQLSPESRTDHSQGWDGTYNGQPMPSDDYWFTVEFTEGGHARTFKAHFAMKR